MSFFLTLHKIHIYEKSINTDKVDIKRIMLSNKESYGNKGSYKYFIGYIHKGNVLSLSLCITFQQMNSYAKYFYKSNKCMNLLINNK